MTECKHKFMAREGLYEEMVQRAGVTKCDTCDGEAYAIHCHGEEVKRAACRECFEKITAEWVRE